MLNNMPNERIAWTVREVAERIGCSPDTIYRMIRSGELPAFRHGLHGKLFISRSEVERRF